MAKPCPETLIISFCVAMILVLSFPLISEAQSNPCRTDMEGPYISDTSTGEPVTGHDFTITATVTDPIGVQYVRLYIYFKVHNGISQSQIIAMMFFNSSYQSTVQVSDDASVMYYTISANDTNGNWNITDVISRNVRDDKNPLAVCATSFTIDMGDTVSFNGTSSTDNVGIANYTWSFPYGGSTVKLYGPAPIFKFGNAGQYAGSLTVKDHWENFNSKSFQVNVLDTEAPKADAGIQMFGFSGNALTFNGTWSSDNVGVTNYTWQFTYGGMPISLYGATPSFVFSTPGLYNVTLTVKDVAGNTDTAAVTAQVMESQQSEEIGSISWWIYVLLIMIFAIVVVGIMIIRT